MSDAELIVSGGQLAVLALQLVVLACQAWFLYGTLDVTRVSANAAKLSAEAANKSADAAEKSVNHIERPYVLVENIAPQIKEYMGGDPAPSDPPHLSVTLKNYGRSPALVLEVRGSLQMTAPGADPFLVPVIPLDNVTVIGPNESWQRTFHYSNLVADGVRSQVERETFHFWFFVSVSYEDMLGKEHQTKMRFRYAPRENKFLVMSGDGYTIRT